MTHSFLDSEDRVSLQKFAIESIQNEQPEGQKLCDPCRKSFFSDLTSLFGTHDYRLDNLDTRCRVCKLLSTLCRSDPAITCLRVKHIDLCVAEDYLDDIGEHAMFPFERLLHILEFMNGLLKMLGRFPKLLIQSWLHNHFPTIQRRPVYPVIGQFPVSHIKIKVYGTHVEGSEETVVERYLRVFAEHGITYKITRLNISHRANDALDSAPAHEQIISGRPILAPDAELNFSRVRNWLDDCLKHHPKCRWTSSGLKVNDTKLETIIPKRLISVGSDNPDTLIPPRIVHTDGLRGKYVALSYCWVQNPLVKLTRSSLRELEAKVDLSLLAETIRDAVTVTRKLKVPYLWVDSLCIIQDDRDDRDEELKKMADIYQGAVLTISALGAHQGEGLFLPRRHNGALNLHGPDKRDVYEVRMDCIVGRNKPSIGEMHLALPLVPHGFRADIAYEYGQSRWYKRGWVLQERLLSRRIIHYGALQIYWECNHGLYAEDGSIFEAISGNISTVNCLKLTIAALFRYLRSPTGAIFENLPLLKNVSLDWVIPRSKRLREALFLNQKSLDEFRDEIWRKVIAQYSTCDLTYQADKLPAISGFTSILGELTRSTACEGLWLEGLGEQLCWRGIEPLMRHADPQGIYNQAAFYPYVFADRRSSALLELGLV